LSKDAIDEAVALAAEQEEMSRDDKLNKIISYADILLLHLIKGYLLKPGHVLR
jgi:hypothetical protein